MGTLFVDKLDPQSGTSLEIGSSGDTITIPSGATITNNGTQTGFGGVNTPLFYVKTTSDQSISDNTYTKVNWGVEVIDTGSAFASDKFTVPSGQAGKYYFGAGVQFGDNTTQQYHYVDLRKNNSVFSSQPTGITTTSNDTNRYYQTIEALVDLSVGDYVEVFALAKFTSGTGTMNYSYFIGYKLVEW